MRPKRLAAVLCVCICLMLGAGITAYAMEIRAYNVAVQYLKDLGVGIDGYSRKEIKLIYSDIQSGEFVKDLTVTILGETAQKAGIDTTGKNAKELFNAISSTEQNMLIAKVTSEQVKKVTADMKYGDVIALLGETIDIGSGTYILQYEVDGKYLLNIMFISLETPCGYSGDELLENLQPIQESSNDKNATGQNTQIVKVTSEQVKKVTADMKYGDVIALLGETIDIGSGTYILQYEVDGKYLLDIVFTSLEMPCGYSGEELLTKLIRK